MNRARIALFLHLDRVTWEKGRLSEICRQTSDGSRPPPPIRLGRLVNAVVAMPQVRGGA
jgi:hypothetical protein